VWRDDANKNLWSLESARPEILNHPPRLGCRPGILPLPLLFSFFFFSGIIRNSFPLMLVRKPTARTRLGNGTRFRGSARKFTYPARASASNEKSLRYAWNIHEVRTLTLLLGKVLFISLYVPFGITFLFPEEFVKRVHDVRHDVKSGLRGARMPPASQTSSVPSRTPSRRQSRRKDSDSSACVRVFRHFSTLYLRSASKIEEEPSRAHAFGHLKSRSG